jgi:hypothetical protein
LAAQSNAHAVLERKVLARSNLMVEGLEGIALTRQAEAEERHKSAAVIKKDLEALARDVAGDSVA